MDGDEHGDAPFLDDDWDGPGERVPSLRSKCPNDSDCYLSFIEGER
jgi:hypothetical protein